VSDAGFATVSPFSLEAADVLDFTTDPLQIAYQLGMSGGGKDGFDFALATASNACFELDSPAGATIYYGPFKEALSAPFDVITGGTCSGLLPELSVSSAVVAESAAHADFTIALSAPSTLTVTVDVSTMDGSATAGSDYTALPTTTISFAPGEISKTVSVTILDDLLGEENETFTLVLSNPSSATLVPGGGTGTITDDEVSACGEPGYDPAVDAGVFVWQDCPSDQWRARFTAGGGSFLRYTGTVGSDQAFNAVMPVSLESRDIFDYTTDPTTITYQLGMGASWQDGFDFTYPTVANVCFGIDIPAGTEVFVGPNRIPVNVPFDLETLGAC